MVNLYLYLSMSTSIQLSTNLSIYVCVYIYLSMSISISFVMYTYIYIIIYIDSSGISFTNFITDHICDAPVRSPKHLTRCSQTALRGGFISRCFCRKPCISSRSVATGEAVFSIQTHPNQQPSAQWQPVFLCVDIYIYYTYIKHLFSHMQRSDLQ